MRRLLPLALALGLSSAGCASAPQPPPTPEGPPASERMEAEVAAFFPLETGRTWHYRGALLGEPVDRTVSIVGRKGGWWLDSEGERYRVAEGSLRTPDRTLLKGPLVRGTSWQSIVALGSIERYRITHDGSAIQVPAGRFQDCVRVVAEERHDPETTLLKEDVYCRGVGRVRMEVWVELAGRGRVDQARLELIETSPGSGGDR